MLKFKPKDFIAALTLVLFTVLKIRGMDGSVDVAVALILGYYFAHRKDGIDNGQ